MADCTPGTSCCCLGKPIHLPFVHLPFVQTTVTWQLRARLPCQVTAFIAKPFDRCAQADDQQATVEPRSSTRAAGVETVSAGWVSTGAPSDSSRDLPAGSARAGMVAGFSRSAGRCPPLVLTGRIWPRRFGSVAHSLAPFGIADYEESKYGSERHQIARGLENESACVRRTP